VACLKIGASILDSQMRLFEALRIFLWIKQEKWRGHENDPHLKLELGDTDWALYLIWQCHVTFEESIMIYRCLSVKSILAFD
jgi:hypothetical protein